MDIKDRNKHRDRCVYLCFAKRSGFFFTADIRLYFDFYILSIFQLDQFGVCYGVIFIRKGNSGRFF